MTRTTPTRRPRLPAAAALLAAGLLAACAGAPTPLPDPGSADARLYADRCGACHSVPHPGRHTLPEWDHMLDRMDRVMAERHVPPLEPGERAAIRAYLARHARGAK